MKKNHSLIKTLGLCIVGIVCVVGASYVYAGVFSLPNTSAPGGNIAIPIHAGAAQVKNGGLSVNTFFANKDAQFNQQVFIDGLIRGGIPQGGDSTSNVFFGGIDGTTPRLVETEVSSDTVADSLYLSDLANPSKRPLCATEGGQIVLCEQSFAYASLFAYQNTNFTVTGGCPVPGSMCAQEVYANNGYAGNSLNFLPGYKFNVVACAPQRYTQDKNFTVKWKSAGTQYQTTVTIYADSSKNNAFGIPLAGIPTVNCSNMAIVNGPSTGSVSTANITDICILPYDPSIIPDPAQQC